MNFQELGLMPLITAALRKQGYERPTPIQRGAIPPALAGRDVLGCAQTGTGKTCAFATPILQRLAQSPRKGPRVIRALVLTPTRELALQIQESFADYGSGLPLRSAVIFGGVGQQPQVDKLRAGLDILVATPGRLLDLHGQGLLDLSGVEIFVLDEADRMLDMGFIHDVRRVLKVLPAKKQTLFFSATMPPEVTELVDSLLHDPARVEVNPVSSPVEVIEQSLYYVDKKNKTALLASLLAGPEVQSALVFTRTKHGANKVVAELGKYGIESAAIHGNKSQTARQKALGDFKAGDIRVLIATDIAARGLDIEELSHVFNYNLPDVPETYVHRIGRTGRAGKGGVAVSFCEFGEKGELRDIERLLGRALPVVESHDWPMQVFEVAPKEPRGRGRAERAPRPEKQAAPKQAKKQQPKSAQQPKPEKQPKSAQQPKPEKQSNPPKAQRPAKAASPRSGDPRQSGQEAARPGGLPRVDLSRAFAGDRLMDATSRMLSSRAPAPKERKASEKPAQKAPGKPAEKAPGKSAHKTAEKPARKAAQSPRKPEPKPAEKRRSRGRNARGPFPVELRKSAQKDSTEQKTLMRPYYMNRDD